MTGAMPRADEIMAAIAPGLLKNEISTRVRPF
jgi:hypothetical protein